MRPDPNVVAAKHREIAQRYKRRARPLNFVRLRINELQRLRAARYPNGIPNTADGLILVRVLLHHLALNGGYGDPRRKLERWIAELAPWMTLAAAKATITDALTRPRRWRADRLAWRLKLTDADRTALKITTIGSIDVGKAQRAERRRLKARQRRAIKRRAKGAKPRAEYITSALSRTKPWEAEGISRRTWERRRRAAVASPAPA